VADRGYGLFAGTAGPLGSLTVRLGGSTLREVPQATASHGRGAAVVASHWDLR
jgi:hypothetical protein